MKSNVMHYFSLIYLIKQLLHVSDLLIAHHQEVFTVYVQQLVRVIHLGDWSGWNSFILTRPAANHLNVQHVPVAVHIR
jgi:hypothetical protein